MGQINDFDDGSASTAGGPAGFVLDARLIMSFCDEPISLGLYVCIFEAYENSRYKNEHVASLPDSQRWLYDSHAQCKK